MRMQNRLFIVLTVSLSMALSLPAAQKKAKDTKSDEASKPSYELPQPGVENLDLTMYQHPRGGPVTFAHHGIRLGAHRWHRTAADRVSKPEEGE
jgi:guanyl-specific ribonuclease Sa